MQWKCFDDAEAFGMTRSVRFGLVAAAVLGLAIAVRLVTLLAWPSVARPDEVFQSLEPAHRLVTGFGIVSWEWRDGIRSWLFPGAIAGLMELARHAGLATGGTLAVVAAAMAALALVPAAVALRAAHGMMPEARVLAMLCAAAPCVLWPDLVHLGPRTMTEVQGGHLLILAGALATPSLADHNKARWCAGLGAVLGLCFCLRFHLLPAMALVAWWRCRGDAAAWRALLAGVAGPLLCAGLLDWVTLGTPFQSVWKNFAVNVVEGRSEDVRYQSAGLVSLGHVGAVGNSGDIRCRPSVCGRYPAATAVRSARRGCPAVPLRAAPQGKQLCLRRCCRHHDCCRNRRPGDLPQSRIGMPSLGRSVYAGYGPAMGRCVRRGCPARLGRVGAVTHLVGRAPGAATGRSMWPGILPVRLGRNWRLHPPGPSGPNRPD